LDVYNWNIIYLGHLYGISKMTIDNLPSNTKETKKPNTNSSHFSLYPNPTHSDFTLSFPHAEKRKIEIFNLNGQQVYSVETSELDLELDLELSEGCYWVKASGASGIAVEKLMVY